MTWSAVVAVVVNAPWTMVAMLSLHAALLAGFPVWSRMRTPVVSDVSVTVTMSMPSSVEKSQGMPHMVGENGE
jgi:hypothetical protein